MTEQTYDNLDTEDMGKFYEENIKSRTCLICGGEIHPVSDKMDDNWWILRSRVWIWKCAGCTFVGNLKDFDNEAARQAEPMNAEHIKGGE